MAHKLPDPRRGRPRHPVTVRIDEARAKLERLGVAVTPAAVKLEVEKTLTRFDLSADAAIDEALNARIAARLKATGQIITGEVVNGSRVRKRFWDSSVAELEEQYEVKRTSSNHDQARLEADRMILEFLREQEATFGYEVYPGLFHADIDRIYAMHGLASPGA
jgi:hypothetical protein